MCDPTIRQLCRLAFLVRSSFPNAMPDRFEVYATPNEGFVNVNMKSTDFIEWMQEHITLHEASRLINMFESDRDDEAMQILKKIYPVLN